MGIGNDDVYDKVGGWVKKGQNHDDVILEWSLSLVYFSCPFIKKSTLKMF